MKRIIYLTLLASLIASQTFAAGPRAWGKSGTATVSNQTLTVGSAASPFGPTLICVENLSDTINIFIDWTDGVASTVDDSTNIKLLPLKSYCFSLDNPDVTNLVQIGIIAASATPAYNAFAIGHR
jgi:hypothetical protein